MVDAVAFVATVAAATARSGVEERVETLSDALALWRGSAFEGVADLEWARAEAVRLEELRLGALEELIEGRLALGQEGQVIGELERLVVTHPLRERFWRQLVVALYRTGRQAEALRRANDLRTMLREELGLDSSAELRELEARVLADDPSLHAAARRRRAASRRAGGVHTS